MKDLRSLLQPQGDHVGRIAGTSQLRVDVGYEPPHRSPYGYVHLTALVGKEFLLELQNHVLIGRVPKLF